MAEPSKPLVAILAAGILLRVVVFAFQGPFNNDKHFQVVQHLHDHGTLPASGEMNQAYQPPLYYLLAAPLLRLGSRKVVQALSLAISIATLLVLFLLLNGLPFVSAGSRMVCLSLTAFLPQFIMYGNYISNDCLTFLLGALLFLQLWRCFRRPSPLQLLVLAACLGSGLLTKATFLAFVPVLAVLAYVLAIRGGARPCRAVMLVTVFLAVSCTIGSYRYIHNLRHGGRLFVTNVDDDALWVRSQRPTNIGLRSFVDINVLKLVRRPTISGHTVHSYPLLFYGSFWYQFIPESSFRGNLTRLKYLGSAIYLVALPVSLLMLAGLLRTAHSLRHGVKLLKLSDREFAATVYRQAAMLLTLANVALLVLAGLKYDIWTIFQSRLFFASLAGVAIMLDAGYALIGHRRHPRLHAGLVASLVVLVALFLTYFVSEIALTVRHPPDPSMDYFLTYPVDMRVAG